MLSHRKLFHPSLPSDVCGSRKEKKKREANARNCRKFSEQGLGAKCPSRSPSVFPFVLQAVVLPAPQPTLNCFGIWHESFVACQLGGPVLRDTARLSQGHPPIAPYMGFLVSQYGQLGAIPPRPFLSVCPLESMRSGGAIPPPPPPKRGISAILVRHPMKRRQMGAIPPSAILSRKGIARYGGGISHWAAKRVS